MKKSKIYFGIMVIIVVISIILMAIAELGEKDIEQVDCYDEKNNKINELTCDKIVYERQNLVSWAFTCIPFMVLFGVLAVSTLFEED